MMQLRRFPEIEPQSCMSTPDCHAVSCISERIFNGPRRCKPQKDLEFQGLHYRSRICTPVVSVFELGISITSPAQPEASRRRPVVLCDTLELEW